MRDFCIPWNTPTSRKYEEENSKEKKGEKESKALKMTWKYD